MGHANADHKKAGGTILISDEVDLIHGTLPVIKRDIS